MNAHDPVVAITLAVRDLAAGRAFYAALGWVTDEPLTSEDAVWVTLTPHLRVVLRTAWSFRDVAGREVAETGPTAEVVMSLTLDSRFHVDQAAERALGAGGVEAREALDHGWSYSRLVADPGGHLWELTWTDDDAA